MGVIRLSFHDLNLNEEELTELMLIARLRIIGIFHRATEPNPRRVIHFKGTARRRGAVRSSGNAIIGCGDGKISTLAHLIAHELGPKNQLLTKDDVRIDIVRDTKEKLLFWAVGELQHQLISSVLCEMRSIHEIYFMDGFGIWQADQSLIDEYQAWRESSRAIRQNGYVNARPFHGRVRSQTMRRGTPPGTSIGGTKQGPRTRSA